MKPTAFAHVSRQGDFEDAINAGVDVLVHTVGDQVLINAGMSNADVLRSATIDPARFLGVDDTMGSITEGKAASFLMLDLNPLEDVRNSQSIHRVMLEGYWIE